MAVERWDFDDMLMRDDLLGTVAIKVDGRLEKGARRDVRFVI